MSRKSERVKKLIKTNYKNKMQNIAIEQENLELKKKGKTN